METKSKKIKLGLTVGAALDVVLIILCLGLVIHPIFSLGNYGLFNAKGATAQAQGRLILTAMLLMLVIVVPVITAGFIIAFKYRAGRGQAYEPDWGDRHRYLQLVWWACPILIIALLSIINFQSAHQLDPSKTIASPYPPLTIEVVALQWKWLFIYPKQNIATVNYIDVPENVPLHFELTADGPMSLFWIPQLGGEMAAMAAMVNQINLIANQTGQFTGQNSEINGAGYSGMKFIVNSTSQTDFNSWVAGVQKSSPPLTQNAYNQLALPTQNNSAAYFGSVDQNLYNTIMMKYMMPPQSTTTNASPTQNMNSMPGMNMGGM